jgi:hypothetical protein
LIDYENVQPDTLGALDKEHFKVVVFVGASQSKVSFEVASLLQRLGSRADYVKISGNGSNALDFHIAFYIGQMAASDPEAYFHIVSKDAGFDPLIAHLKSRKILACRSRSVADMPIVKAANSKSLPERMQVVVANLLQRGSARPRTIKTLSSSIGSLFQKTLPEGEIGSILQELQDKGYIAVSEGKVVYTCSDLAREHSAQGTSQ